MVLCRNALNKTACFLLTPLFRVLAAAAAAAVATGLEESRPNVSLKAAVRVDQRRRKSENGTLHMLGCVRSGDR